MKATYQDFLAVNRNCSGFANNADAQALFELMNRDEHIIAMVESCEANKPALAGCVVAVEVFYDNLQQPTIDLNDDFTRTVVGRMVKSILEPFGYVPTVHRKLSKNCNARYFRSASLYEPTGPATMRIVKHIEMIPQNAVKQEG